MSIFITNIGGSGGTGGSGLQSKCIYVDALLGSDVTGDGGSTNQYQTITYALSQITDNNINSYTLMVQGDFSAEGTVPLKKNVSLVGLGNRKDNLVSVILNTLEAFNTNQLLANFSGNFLVSSATDLNTNTYVVQDILCASINVTADVAGTTSVTMSNVECTGVPTFVHTNTLRISGCRFTGSSTGQTLRIRGGTNAVVRGTKILLSVHGTVVDSLTPTLDIDDSASSGASITGAISAIKFSGYSARGSSGNASLLGYGSPTTLLLDTVTAGSDITVSLPSYVDYQGKPVTIKKATGGAFKILIAPAGGEEIDNSTVSYKLINQNDSVTIVSAEGSGFTGWKIISSVGSTSSSAKNYIVDSDGNSLGAWITYINPGVNIPSTGTGSPALDFTLTTTTSTPLSGSSSFLLTAAAANCVGEGISVPFVIDSEDKANLLTISFSYNASSGFVTSDGTPPLMDGSTSYNSGNSGLQVFIRDEDNGILVPVNSSILLAKGDSNFKYNGTFQTSPNAVNYRLILHCPRNVGASAYTFKFDSVSISPMVTIQASQLVEASAVLSAQTTFGSNVPIVFDQSLYDTNAAYNTATGIYTCPVSGIYTVICNAAALTASTQTLSVTKNGVNYGYLYTFQASSYIQSGSVSIKCLAGDEITITSDASVTLRAPDPTNKTYFSISCSSPVAIAAAGLVAAKYSAINTSVGAGATTVLVATTQELDKTASYNTTTGLFTCPISGTYRVSAGALGSFAAGNLSGTNVYVSLKVSKNGTPSSTLGGSSLGRSAGTDFVSMGGSTLIECLAGDTLSVVLTNGTAQTMGFNNDSTDWVSFDLLPSLSVTAAPATVAASYYAASTNGIGPASPGIFDTILIDTMAAFNPATGQFTCPVSGLYNIAVFLNLSAATGCSINIYKNNTKNVPIGFNSSNALPSASGFISCLAGDILDVRTNTALNLNGGAANADSSTIYITKIG